MLLEKVARLFRARKTAPRPRGKIIIIECQAEIAELLAVYLEAKGYAARWTTDETEGLRLARELEPDLILLCTFLPKGGTGLDLCNALRWGLGLPKLKIIMISGDPRESVRARALAAGADLYFEKPVACKTLLAAAERLLGK